MMMIRLTVCIVQALALSLFLMGQDVADAPQGADAAVTDVRLIGRPDTAVKIAATDARALLETDPDQAANSFYVWIRDPQDKDMDYVYDFVLNTAVSHSPVLLKADRLRSDAGILLRLDLREWLPDSQLRSRFKQLMNSDYFDPSFYVRGEDTVGGVAEVKFSPSNLPYLKELLAIQHPNLVFQNVANSTEADQDKRIKVYVDPYVKDAVQYNAAYVVNPQSNLPVATGTIFGPAIQSSCGQDAQDLTSITGMNVPIVEAERFLVLALRTLEGGLYYKLQGLIDAKDKRLTQKEWLATFGADEELSASLGGREFVGMWHSAVTSKPRKIAFFYGRNLRPSSGLPLIVVTQDNLDETNGTSVHPMYSLLDVDFDATEILATKPNGMIAYGLFDGKGVLQDAAPDNLVRDHTVPKPFTSRLEPGISCIRCHGPYDQWMPVKNHVKTLLSSLDAQGQKLSVIGDSSDDADVAELQVKLAQLYQGDIESALQLARDQFERSCGKLIHVVREQADYAKWSVQILSDKFAKYRYTWVDPAEALRTLGVVVPPEQADKYFQEIVPSAAKQGPNLFDIALFTLRSHNIDKELVISREDWERVYQATLAYAVENGNFPLPVEAKNEQVVNP